MKLTERQLNLLKVIIEEHILIAQPISSKLITKKYMKNLSPQTIRNEMNYLEKINLLQKSHASSGRIPTIQGYKYYEANILKTSVSNEIKQKLQIVLKKRNISIDSIIDETASLIEEILKLPTVVHSQNNSLLLKRFDLIPISDKLVLIILITSSGDIIKNKIHITNNKQLEDVAICTKIFNDRLVDTPINEISKKLNVIKEIIRNSVHQYEFVIQNVIKKIFEFNTIDNKKKIYGIKNLTAQPEFRNIDNLHNILMLLDNSSIWKHIAYSQEKTGKTKITFINDVGEKDITIASTSVKTNNSVKQISIVGPTRMNYSEVKGLLDYIKDELEKINN